MNHLSSIIHNCTPFHTPESSIHSLDALEEIKEENASLTTIALEYVENQDALQQQIIRNSNLNNLVIELKHQLARYEQVSNPNILRELNIAKAELQQKTARIANLEYNIQQLLQANHAYMQANTALQVENGHLRMQIGNPRVPYGQRVYYY